MLSPMKGVPFEHYILRMSSWLIKTIRLYMNDLEAGAGTRVRELCSVVSDCIGLCTSKRMPITQITLASAQGTLLPLPTCPSQTIAFYNVARRIKSIITMKLKGVEIGHLCSRFFSCLCIDLPITVLFSQSEMFNLCCFYLRISAQVSKVICGHLRSSFIFVTCSWEEE